MYKYAYRGEQMHVYMLVSVYQEKGHSNTGAELQAETQLRSLQAKGHAITIIAKKRTWQSPFHETINGVEVYRLWPPGIRTLCTLLLLFLARKNCDIVHIHGQHLFGVAAIGLCRLLGIPTVLKITIAGRFFVRLSADKLFPRKWRPFRRLLNLVSRKASAYLAISKEINDQLSKAGFLAERIVHIPNGVDLNRFHPVSVNEKKSLRKQLQLPEDQQLVLYSSRLIYRKGFDLLLTAWPTIHEKFPECCLVVVGGGSEAEVAQLNTLSRTMGKATIFHIGEVPNIAPYLQCADIFVFPSRKEGLPNTLIEAMACGIACVASDIGGCTDLIEPNKTGLLFESSHAAALSSAAISLLSNQSKINELGTNAYKHIYEKYNIHAVADQLHALYITLQNQHTMNNTTISTSTLNSKQ